jgi:hypothetical protein
MACAGLSEVQCSANSAACCKFAASGAYPARALIVTLRPEQNIDNPTAGLHQQAREANVRAVRPVLQLPSLRHGDGRCIRITGVPPGPASPLDERYVNVFARFSTEERLSFRLFIRYDI